MGTRFVVRVDEKIDCVFGTRMTDPSLTRKTADRIVFLKRELKSERQTKEMHHVRSYSSLSL
jgi:hypothetical protein